MCRFANGSLTLAKLVASATDGVPVMTWWAGLGEKIREENCVGKLAVFHLISSQCSTRVVNFISAKGLNLWQFKVDLNECGPEYTEMPYHTQVRWLSRGKVSSRYLAFLFARCLFAHMLSVEWSLFIVVNLGCLGCLKPRFY